jgi:hypothetical protein
VIVIEQHLAVGGDTMIPFGVGITLTDGTTHIGVGIIPIDGMTHI